MFTALVTLSFVNWALAHLQHPRAFLYGLMMEAMLIAVILAVNWVAVKAEDSQCEDLRGRCIGSINRKPIL